MRQTKIIMGMPVTVEIVDSGVISKDLAKIFAYFDHVDKKFSTYKKTSEISQINQGKLKKKDFSPEMREVLALCAETKKLSDGFFNIRHNGKLDPSGLVKGWAINNAAKLLKQMGFANFYVDAGGDIQVAGKNNKGKNWRVGIKNPFNQEEIVKVLEIAGQGVATSGTYIRGLHIYNPKGRGGEVSDVVSLTVIGPNIYEADRFATAAFAMGRPGIAFIERLPRFEGYQIEKEGVAVFTTGFTRYIPKR